MITSLFIRVSGGIHRVQTMKVVPGDVFKVKRSGPGVSVIFTPERELKNKFKYKFKYKLQSSWLLIRTTYLFKQLKDGIWVYEAPRRPYNIPKETKFKKHVYSLS